MYIRFSPWKQTTITLSNIQSRLIQWCLTHSYSFNISNCITFLSNIHLKNTSFPTILCTNKTSTADTPCWVHITFSKNPLWKIGFQSKINITKIYWIQFLLFFYHFSWYFILIHMFITFHHVFSSFHQDEKFFFIALFWYCFSSCNVKIMLN